MNLEPMTKWTICYIDSNDVLRIKSIWCPPGQSLPLPLNTFHVYWKNYTEEVVGKEK